MMKKWFIFLPGVILMVLLTACAGDASFPSEQVEGFDFSEAEAVEIASDEGIDYSDDEGVIVDGEEGFDFTEEEAVEIAYDEGIDFSDDEGLVVDGEEGNDQPDGMSFNDDEAVDISVESKEVYPPEGTSNWLFDHDAAIANCEGKLITMSDPESEMLQITLGAEGASLVISELYADTEAFYSLDYANENAAQYYGYANFEGYDHHYTIQFVSLENTTTADFLVGSLKAEIEGCVLTRSFGAYLVDIE